MVVAFAFRGPLTFLLFRVGLVDTTGAPASRWRALIRAGCAWSPVLALQLAPQPVKLLLATTPMAALTALGGLAVIMLGGAGWAIVRPERGPQDLISGTWVVPK